MPQINLDYIDAEILIVALAEYSISAPDMIERAERMHAQLDVLLDDRDKVKRLTDALQELHDAAREVMPNGASVVRRASTVLRELRKASE